MLRQVLRNLLPLTLLHAYKHAAEEGIEIHGGIGFTWEMDCHLYLRRSRHLGQLIGSEHAWRDRLAQQLITEAA